MSVVSQDTVLFNDTIAANISMGKSGATQEEIAAAARIANADTFIAECPDGIQKQASEITARNFRAANANASPLHGPYIKSDILILGRSDLGTRHGKRELVQDAPRTNCWRAIVLR